jgi:hypothetical protein
MGKDQPEKSSSSSWSLSDFIFFAAFWAGIFVYYNYAGPIWDRLFLDPAISQAEALEAQGRLPEAQDLLLAKAKDYPQNPKLLWALGDYYTKTDSPVLARFYFQALTHVDAKDLDPERVAFAKSWQGNGTDVQHEVQDEVDAPKTKHMNSGARTAFPDSVNGMLNEPAAKLDITAGYFDPDYPIAATCSNGGRCERAFDFGRGNLWQAIAAQHLAVDYPYGGKDCCTLALDDTDLRSLSVVEGEFLQKLQTMGDQYASDSAASNAALLAFRARVLAKQRYVLGFLDGASTAAPPPPPYSALWSSLRFWGLLIGWFIFVFVVRDVLEGRIAKWREASRVRAAAKPQSATPQAARSASSVTSNASAAMPMWRRIAYFAFALLLILSGAGYIADSANTFLTGGDPVVVPTYFKGGSLIQTTHLSTEESRTNGINFAAGLSLLMVGLLATNRGSRRSPKGPGIVDNAIGRLSAGTRTWQIVAVAATLSAFGIFGDLYFGHTVTHWDTESAVTALKTEVGPLDIYVNGDWIYGISADGNTTHIAVFSPTLYRALDRANVEIGEFKYPFEFPVPGFLPILMVIGLCAAALWRGRAPGSDAPGLWTARSFLAFAFLQLYVVLWLLSAQAGLEIRSGYNPDWMGPALFLLVSQLVLIASVYDRLKANVLAAAQQWAWIGLYFATSLAMLPWAYHFSEASWRAPGLLWITLYLGFVSLLWCLMMVRRRATGAVS